MKHLLLSLLLATFATANLMAQALVVDPNSNPITVEGYADESDIVAHATIQNNTQGNITLVWQRVTNNLTAGWTSLICDAETCWGPNTVTNSVVLSAGQTSVMDTHFKPHDAVGTGNVVIKAWVQNDSAATVRILEYQCNALLTGIYDPFPKGTLRVYPNPARNYVNVSFSTYDQIRSIEIYDIIGQRVNTFYLPFGTETYYINTEELQEGMYFMSLYNEQKKRVSTKVFSKIQ